MTTPYDAQIEKMSGEILCLTSIPTLADELSDLIGKKIAYRIRAELVCCDIYAKVNDDPSLDDKQRSNVLGKLVLSREWHDLCYWGEAAARLADGTVDNNTDFM
jgi:hypothetical protein